MAHAPIRLCHRCKEMRQRAHGVAVCNKTGVDIFVQVQNCPLGKNEQPMEEDNSLEGVRRALKSGGCCGSPAAKEE